MAIYGGESVRTLPDILREHATRIGGKTAYRDDRRAVTYEELEQRTGRVAGHLVRLGVRRGDRVAIHLGNRVELVESWLGVLRAGAIGVLLNPAASEEELAYFLDDSGAVAIVTEQPLAQLSAVQRVIAVGQEEPTSGAIASRPSPRRIQVRLPATTWGSTNPPGSTTPRARQGRARALCRRSVRDCGR
ncbi:AMP-binding protein [Streptomyces sp. NPDC087305]|uniref:AMP-binding protein n=1 Tax=Streptomyces sp. NPDC087305 TaxID=3365781 RepID=UPI003820550C